MSYSKSVQRQTSKFPIISDPSGIPCIYKVYFGKKYLIWKGKSLTQSCEVLSKSIQAGISKLEIEREHHLYHVIKHILKTRVVRGVAEIVFDDYILDSGKIKGLQMLKDEQMLIDSAIDDSLCLNNNAQAYVPLNTSYISETEKVKFIEWYEKRIKK